MPDAAQDDWVRRVLGLDPSGGQQSVASALNLGPRLVAIREDMMLHGAAAELTGPLKEAATAVKANDPNAAGLVDALETRLAAIAGAARQAEAASLAAKVGTLGPVAFAKLRLRLEHAQSTFADAMDNLKAACEALLETDDFADDPRSTDPATFAAIAAIDQRIPSMKSMASNVNDAIDAMANTPDPAARAKHAQGALQAITAYRSRIDDLSVLRKMEQTEAGTFMIHGAITAVLDDLSQALRA